MDLNDFENFDPGLISGSYLEGGGLSKDRHKL